jgi:hypothetical protein
MTVSSVTYIHPDELPHPRSKTHGTNCPFTENPEIQVKHTFSPYKVLYQVYCHSDGKLTNTFIVGSQKYFNDERIKTINEAMHDPIVESVLSALHHLENNILFGSQFQRFQSLVTWPSIFGPVARQHHSRECIVGLYCWPCTHTQRRISRSHYPFRGMSPVT